MLQRHCDTVAEGGRGCCRDSLILLRKGKRMLQRQCNTGGREVQVSCMSDLWEVAGGAGAEGVGGGSGKYCVAGGRIKVWRRGDEGVAEGTKGLLHRRGGGCCTWGLLQRGPKRPHGGRGGGGAVGRRGKGG
eukprot:363609-Chlamydomonas_euryale.AAC.18